LAILSRIAHPFNGLSVGENKALGGHLPYGGAREHRPNFRCLQRHLGSHPQPIRRALEAKLLRFAACNAVHIAQ
jgi:hypothetical protein